MKIWVLNTKTDDYPEDNDIHLFEKRSAGLESLLDLIDYVDGEEARDAFKKRAPKTGNLQYCTHDMYVVFTLECKETEDDNFFVAEAVP